MEINPIDLLTIAGLASLGLWLEGIGWAPLRAHEGPSLITKMVILTPSVAARRYSFGPGLGAS